ncbi:dolichyl-phosphate-mannose--protein mannosyltransferase [Micrococcoides hystricis]|uniref:Polyprenol-phosphate-mannose--protein mannosyltransferase n=1 Tax=Micrococcoides hystricis TaxID=1572761 RepID=A0ABV6PAA0_9MICC
MSITTTAPERRRPTTGVPARLRARLSGDPVVFTRWGWAAFAVVTVVAGLLRFWNLDYPGRLIFDETYYVKDGWALWNFGHEMKWPEEPNPDFVAGNPQPLDEPGYVVHPPLGKWIIGAGMAIFGVDNGYGWRFSAAAAGTIMVFLFMIIVTRMLRAQFFGVLGGILMAVDGHHLVLSRTGLLDIFLALFVLAAFLALLYDQRWHRQRLLQHAVSGQQPRFVARLWRPWWLLAAVLLACATSVKLSALAFVGMFCLLSLAWDWQGRRILAQELPDQPAPLRTTFLYDWFPALLTAIPLYAVSYVATWSGWIFGSGGYGRQWSAEHPSAGIGGLFPDWFRSLYRYHRESTQFHAGLSSEHSYASTPWTWWFMGRPTSFFYEGTKRGEDGCVHESCSAAITDLANPMLWWAGALAFLVVLFLAVARNDWRAWAIIAAYIAGFFVWLAFPDRTMFFFYTIAYQPFLILAVLLALAWLMRLMSRRQLALTGRYSRAATLGAIGFVVAVVAVSAFFLPVWTGEQINYDAWRARMWFSSWI